jgi:hypothetical protein
MGYCRSHSFAKLNQNHNQTIPFPIPTHNNILYSKEDHILLVTASSAIIIIVHSTEVSALYPYIVILSPIGN